jgi:hypothetical protein
MDERPLTCFHEIPEVAEGISSKTGSFPTLDVWAPKLERGSAALAPTIKDLCRKFRREIPKAFPIFGFTQFSGSVFLRAGSLGCGFALQCHFAVGIGLASRARESGCELIVPRWISRLHFHVGLQGSHRVGKFP